MQPERLPLLFQRYTSGTASGEELDEFMAGWLDPALAKTRDELLVESFESPQVYGMRKEQADAVYLRIMNEIRNSGRVVPMDGGMN